MGDGLALLTIAAAILIAAGFFAWFLAISDRLLPHDLAWLTITEAQLRGIADGRLVHFMAHDRAAFGGTLVAVGVLYLWLVRSPLSNREAWAWWVVALSGALGFATFLSYLGTGYLDTWHGVATLALLPLFVVGLVRSWPRLELPRGIRTLGVPGARPDVGSRAFFGRGLLLLTAIGMVVAGLTIVTIGTVVVFVPQDLEFIGLDRLTLDAIDPHLVPLIAHDRAGFGGGLATTGLIVLGCVWRARPSPSLWEALLVAGVAGFGAAIGIHGLIGYLDLTHVGPAILGGFVFAGGIILSRPSMLDDAGLGAEHRRRTRGWTSGPTTIWALLGILVCTLLVGSVQSHLASLGRTAEAPVIVLERAFQAGGLGYERLTVGYWIGYEFLVDGVPYQGVAFERWANVDAHHPKACYDPHDPANHVLVDGSASCSTL